MEEIFKIEKYMIKAGLQTVTTTSAGYSKNKIKCRLDEDCYLVEFSNSTLKIVLPEQKKE